MKRILSFSPEFRITGPLAWAMAGLFLLPATCCASLPQNSDHDSRRPAQTSPADRDLGRPGQPRWWGNVLYVDLAVGDTCEFLGRTIRLVSRHNNYCTVDVDGERESLCVASLELPRVVNGVRMFLADNKGSANTTTNRNFPKIRASLTRDALLALSNPSNPLLDPNLFTFPISREDGFEWTMGENSHMFAYLRPARSHEGVDINMHRARGKEIDALVAIEDGTIRWIGQGSPQEAALLLESATFPGIYYVYQHLNRDKVFVKAGQRVRKGQRLAFADGRQSLPCL